MFRVMVDDTFDFLSSEYADLFQRSEATAFQHPLWLSEVYRRLAPAAAAEPAVTVVRTTNDDRLVAVLPLVKRRQYGMRVVEFADFGVTDYAAPVCDAEICRTNFEHAAVFAAIRRALKPFDVLRLRKLRATSQWTAFFSSERVSAMSLCRHGVDIYEPISEWRRQNIDRTTLKELDQKWRQLRREGDVRLELVMDPERIRDSLAAMRQFREPRFRDREGDDLFQSQAFYDFYLDVAVQGKDSLARTYALLVNERPVAICFGLEHDGAFLMVAMGFDRDAYKNRSVGLLLIDEVIADCIRRSDRVFDLTIGNESYKAKFGTAAEPVYETWMPGGAMGAIGIAARAYLPQAKELARRLGLTS